MSRQEWENEADGHEPSKSVMRQSEGSLAAPSGSPKLWMCPFCGHKMTEEESKGYKGCPTGFHFVQHERFHPCASCGVNLLPAVDRAWRKPDGSIIHICPSCADKKVLTGWLASQSDMLSEDWEILD